MLKIDVFDHLFPKRYFDQMVEVRPDHKDIGKGVRNVPLSDRYNAVELLKLEI